MMALRTYVIVKKPRSGCLEGRTALIQPNVNTLYNLAPAFEESKLTHSSGRLPGEGRDPLPHQLELFKCKQ